MRLKVIIGLVLTVVIIGLTVFLLQPPKDIRIVDAATAKGISDKLKPVGITSVFPAGTSAVNCWFLWNNAKPNTSLLASWRYVTDDVHILDYTFDIPRKSGSGGISLTMPAGKELPAGQYRVDLKKDKRVLRSLNFKVLEKL